MAACNALKRERQREAAKFSHRLQRNANAVHTHQCARGGQHHRRGRFAVNCRRAIIMCVHLYDLALVDRPLSSHRSPMRKSQQRSISFHPVVGHNAVPRYLLCCSAIGRAAPRNSAVIASVFSLLFLSCSLFFFCFLIHQPSFAHPSRPPVHLAQHYLCAKDLAVSNPKSSSNFDSITDIRERQEIQLINFIPTLLQHMQPAPDNDGCGVERNSSRSFTKRCPTPRGEKIKWLLNMLPLRGERFNPVCRACNIISTPSTSLVVVVVANDHF